MAQYDAFAEQYHEMVKTGGQHKVYAYIVEQLRNDSDLRGKSVCDVGCGQGELACLLSMAGANATGVDASEKQLEYAKAHASKVDWMQDDAMELSKIADETYDYAVSSLMLMDVPDHLKVFRAACRILKPGGIMVWVVMHPCFQSPFSHPTGDGARKVTTYAPQFWKSLGVGTLRATLGAYHRPLSMYVNDFLAAGFSLLRMDELERHNPGAVDDLPLHLAVVGRKV